MKIVIIVIVIILFIRWLAGSEEEYKKWKKYDEEYWDDDKYWDDDWLYGNIDKHDDNKLNKK